MMVGLVFIFAYHIINDVLHISNAVYIKLIKPLHSFMASLCDRVSFSVAELLIGIVAISVIVYTVQAVIKIIIKKNFVNGIIAILITYLCYFTCIYGGFCILWGVYYSAEDMGIKTLCGLSPEGNTHEELILVDKYFVDLANEYSVLVERDNNGCFVMDKDRVFNHSTMLYDNVSKKYPGLASGSHRAKEVHFSRIVSYMDFTGFFFPFTAEANINTDAPDSMTPSVIAHELAHQRGIAEKDEANFVAVLSCLEDGDPDYVYSGCLMALIHLQNALYKSGDIDAWSKIRENYSEGVLNDLIQNNEYWEPFRKTAAYKATNSAYDAFLKSYDQSMGVETYGACVDLIVDYYKKFAKN